MLRNFLRRLSSLIAHATRRYFVAGLLALAPIAVTFWITLWIIERLDSLILPHVLRLAFPELESPPDIPLVGALFTFAVIILSGVVVVHLFGHEVIRLSERLLAKVPVARSIYAGVKQLFQAIVTSNDRTTFSRVVLVEYPRRGIFAVAFATGPARGAVQTARPEPLVNVFLPTTPNPTSGFYLLVPEADVQELDLSVEDAFKLVMSAGLVTPDAPRSTPALPHTAPRPATDRPGLSESS